MHHLFHVQKPYRGFSCHPISKHLMHRISGISYHENEIISPSQLRYLRIPYIDFNGETRTGEMICNQSIAMPLLDIFHTLYEQRYPIERIQLVDDFQADDDLCCLKNNTSCFNYRTICGTDTLSRHAFGMAVDVNPFFNPYVTYIKDSTKDMNNSAAVTDDMISPSSTEASHKDMSNAAINADDMISPSSTESSHKDMSDSATVIERFIFDSSAGKSHKEITGAHIRISPPGSEAYADRERDFPHKLGPGDLCYELFISHGFRWGGDWTHCKDYQHFEI